MDSVAWVAYAFPLELLCYEIFDKYCTMEFSFEDSLFESPCAKKQSAAAVEAGYTPKLCDALWFTKIASCDDQNEANLIMKFRADLLYYRHEYEQALSVYQNLQSSISVRENSFLREVCGAQVKCLIKLNRLLEASQMCQLIFQHCQLNPQDCALLAMAADVFFKCDDIPAALLAIQHAISSNVFAPDLWILLSDIYLHIKYNKGKGALETSDRVFKEETCKDCSCVCEVSMVTLCTMFSDQLIEKMSFVCLARARFLSMERNHCTSRAADEVSSRISKLELAEDEKTTLRELLHRHILQDQPHVTESSDVLCEQLKKIDCLGGSRLRVGDFKLAVLDFNRKWFSFLFDTASSVSPC